MNLNLNQLTPYPEVDAILRHLTGAVQTVLGADFVGLYLFGSLSSGDFDPDRSDIDFVVVTRSLPTDEQTRALEAMHHGIYACGLPWATKLEGTYIPQADLRRYDRAGGPYPGYNEGEFAINPHGHDWIIQRHIVRESGVIVAGPDPRPWIDPITPDDLRRAAACTLDDWWRPMLRDNPGWLAARTDYQAFAVETMCRVLYTVETGQVGSKRASAEWALSALEPRWQSLIRLARAWSHKADQTQFDALYAAPDFLAYTLARIDALALPEVPSC